MFCLCCQLFHSFSPAFSFFLRVRTLYSVLVLSLQDIFVIAGGSVLVQKQVNGSGSNKNHATTIDLAILRKEDIFGEVSLLNPGKPACASVIALGTCVEWLLIAYFIIIIIMTTTTTIVVITIGITECRFCRSSFFKFACSSR